VLTGGYQESGSLTFTLTAPNSSVVDTQTITPSGDGTYTTSNTNIATQAGTYTWTVSYAGDGLNNGTHDQGGAAEQVTTVKASPTLVSTASFKTSSNVVGTAIPEDSAVLSGGYQESGSLTFILTAPNNSVVDTQTITPNGDGTYSTTNATIATQAGTYTWTVSFAGDGLNIGAHDQGGAAEQVTTLKASPTLVTTASFKTGSGNVVGAAIPEDSAVLSGGYQESGPLTFTLTAPNNSVVDTETITPTGDGTYSTTNTTIATQAGIYTWTVSYAGDGLNNGRGDQGGAAEQVTTLKASPTLVTTALFKAGSGNVVGSAIPEDSAVLSGGYQESGPFTFTLTAPNNSVAYTQTISPNGNGTYVTSNATTATQVMQATG
jgi:deoxycytidylate deaminase